MPSNRWVIWMNDRWVPSNASADQTPFPKATLTLEHVSFGNQISVSEETRTLRDAVEELCYDYLRQKHDGWENHDGAYGIFEIDVSERTIELEFNERFVGTETFTHTF